MQHCLELLVAKDIIPLDPFKLIGGTGKGCPTEKDLQAAVDFYKELDK